MRRGRRKNATPFRSAACHAPRLRHWHGCPTLTRQAIVAARPASPGSARPGAPSYLIFFPLSCSSPGDRPASPIFADIPQTSASLPGGGSLSGVRPKELEPGGVDTAAQVGLLQESSRSRKALKDGCGHGRPSRTCASAYLRSLRCACAFCGQAAGSTAVATRCGHATVWAWRSESLPCSPPDDTDLSVQDAIAGGHAVTIQTGPC
jgi:hypothetical protein